MKYLIAVVITALVTGLAVTAYFKGWFPQITFTKPQAVSIQSTEVSTPITSAQVSASPSATPADETEVLKAAIKTQLVAEHGSNAESLNITISKIVGGYAQGSATERGGGGMWLAAKVNGNWILVWDGNGTISCTSLVPYPSFPASLAPECWDEVTGKLKSR